MTSCNKPDFKQTVNLMKLTSLFPLVKKLYKQVSKIDNLQQYAKGKGLELVEVGPLLETSIFPLSFQVVREPLPFAYH